MRSFRTSFNLGYFTGVKVTASLLDPTGFFSVFKLNLKECGIDGLDSSSDLLFARDRSKGPN